MAKKTSLRKIKELIANSDSPLYLYDDDPDGLCSFLLLKRKFKNGCGIPIKTAPKLGINFLDKINRHSYDLIVILDKPIVEQGLINAIKKPIVYIDHHPIQELNGIYYYNPKFKNKNDASPTTKICYDIVKSDEWLAAAGIISDWHMPRFIKKLERKYPDLIKHTKNPADILFKQKFGKLIRIFSFILKGDNKNLKECVRILENAESPYEVLNNKDCVLMHRFNEVAKIYEELLLDAMNGVSKDKLVVFSYVSGKVSLTGDLANEMYYRFPDKLVVIAREKDNEMRLSMRGSNALKHLKKALDGVSGYGGGHENACGGAVAKEDFMEFLAKLRNLVN